MLPTKSRIHGLSSTLLVCLCVIVPFILSLVPQSLSVVTEIAAGEEFVQIAPGTSVSRQVTAGAKEVLGVFARAGTMLRLTIDKGDLALTTAVYGPSGIGLVTHVSEDFEVVEISVPAGVTGTYKIEIQSRENVDNPRRYELTVRTLIPITQAGLKDSEAWQAIATAGLLRAKWTKASLKQAMEEYDKAAQIWTSVGNLTGASQATLKSGDICFLLSEYSEALKRYQNASTLAAKASARVTEARALSRMGRLYSYTGKNDLAHSELTRAMNLLGPVDANTNAIARNAHGEALSNMAEVFYSKGNLMKSSDELRKALKFLVDDRKGEAKVHLFAGHIAGSVGVRERAISEISQALDLYRATADKSGEGLALTTLGIAHSYIGKHDQAIKLHNEAIEVFQSIGDRHSEAIALNAVGQAYEKLTDYRAALVHYQKAFEIFHDRGASDLEAVTILLVANIHRLRNDFDEALKFYERGLQMSRSAEKLRTEANALTEIALVYASQHRTDDTLQQYNKVLKFYERINDHRGQAIALNGQGDFLLQIGKKVEAAKSFRRAFALSENGADVGVRIDALYNLARAERSLGHLDEALSFINRSLKIIEELRKDVGSSDLRASYFSGVQKNYELCIDILTDLDQARPGNGFAAEALSVSEKRRARLLVDLIREAGADLRQGAPKELITRERELRGLIQKQAQYQLNLQVNGKNSSEVADVENQVVQLRSEYQRIQSQLREQNPRALSLAQFERLTVSQIQNELRADDILLEFSLGEERSHLWVVTTKLFQSFQLPPREEIEAVAIELYKAVTTRQQLDGKKDGSAYQTQIETSDKLYLAKAVTLSRMLFGQIATQLEAKRLVLVTEGALQLVPFAALPVPAEQTSSNWLILDHEIVQLPSIATLRAIRALEKRDRDSAYKIAAVLADPVFTRTDGRVQGSSLSPAIASAAPDENRHESGQRALESLRSSSGPSRLTHASEEADAIAAAAPSGTTMIAKGFEATRETAMSVHLRDYQILHFATHGHLDSEHPELSGIVLTMVDKYGVEKNGVMPLHDIYSLDLSAELTVLSACQTALGKDIKGEGFVGLSHSFMSAGSKSVVSSLWKVDDRATASLMADFYQSMLQKGMSPAAALRAAKLKLMQDKRWNAPYFWAGFVVQGEYTNHIAVQSNSWPNLGVVILLSLLLTSSSVIFFKRRRTRRIS